MWSDRNWNWIVPVGTVIGLVTLFVLASILGNHLAPGDLN
jgi:putative Ca2+/H+ antiporter (TMEM165/GDT1 family)